MIEVTISEVLLDEGTIVLFGGTLEDGHYVTVAVDHRMAQDIADALSAGEQPVALAEAWQLA